MFLPRRLHQLDDTISLENSTFMMI